LIYYRFSEYSDFLWLFVGPVGLILVCFQQKETVEDVELLSMIMVGVLKLRVFSVTKFIVRNVVRTKIPL